MQRASILAAVLMLALAPQQVRAQGTGLDPCGNMEGAFAFVFVSGSCFDLSGAITTEDEKLWTLSVTGFDLGDFGELRSLTAAYNSDPFINFGVSTVNAVEGPLTYAFLFGIPVVPDFYTDAMSSAGVSLTSGVGTALLQPSLVYETYVSGYGTVDGAPTNLAVDNGMAECAAAAAATETCDYGEEFSSFAPTFYNDLEALLTYQQTGLGSVASWSGRVELTVEREVVPEPASLLLLGTGFIGLAGIVNRRRRRDA